MYLIVLVLLCLFIFVFITTRFMANKVVHAEMLACDKDRVSNEKLILTVLSVALMQLNWRLITQ